MVNRRGDGDNLDLDVRRGSQQSDRRKKPGPKPGLAIEGLNFGLRCGDVDFAFGEHRQLFVG